MDRTVKKLLFFTLSACPLGRSMGTVLKEVRGSCGWIELETVFVDVQTELTNQHRVKKNPTVLFLDGNGHELYRIDEFMETEHVIKLIELLGRGEVEPGQKVFDKNQESEEKYTIYLLQNDHVVPAELVHVNKTSVRSPRITAVKLLIHTKLDGFRNPFPESASLELMRFKENRAEVILNMSAGDRSKANREEMQLLLAKTLSHFGIEEVEVTIGD